MTYTLKEDNCLMIEMEAIPDRATPINMAQHSYFNLAGVDRPGNILDHVLYVNRCSPTPWILAVACQAASLQICFA